MGKVEKVTDRDREGLDNAIEFLAILNRLPDNKLPLVKQIFRRLTTLQRGRARYLATKGGPT